MQPSRDHSPLYAEVPEFDPRLLPSVRRDLVVAPSPYEPRRKKNLSSVISEQQRRSVFVVRFFESALSKFATSGISIF